MRRPKYSILVLVGLTSLLAGFLAPYAHVKSKLNSRHHALRILEDSGCDVSYELPKSPSIWCSIFGWRYDLRHKWIRIDPGCQLSMPELAEQTRRLPELQGVLFKLGAISDVEIDELHRLLPDIEVAGVIYK
ncbi:hypothetical protein MFFC18_21450 [Mariniblastus fucicola]|uniref:Uncharacterized protein n=1 Tax=Mariniblastus fucicola TaxID=980251 RepID=A0A5B9P9X8_9BACT|nr:hypothetical protein MFFC18_21450 [Mariniblastus fucicola]